MQQQYHAPNTWKGRGWKKPLWRQIRDVFDDTEKPSSKQYLQKLDSIVHEPITSKRYYNSNVTSMSQHRYNLDIEEIPFHISIPKVKFNVAFKEISIPIRSIHIAFKKRPITLSIPRINVNFLRKLTIISVLATIPLILILSAFLTWRVISLTDGDYLGKVYLYKVDKFMNDRIIPIEASVESMKEKVKELEVKEEVRRYKEQVNYRPIIKKYNIYNAKGTLIKTETSE